MTAAIASPETQEKAAETGRNPQGAV